MSIDTTQIIITDNKFISCVLFESKRPQGNTHEPGGHWFMKKTWSWKSRVKLPLSVKGLLSLLDNTSTTKDMFSSFFVWEKRDFYIVRKKCISIYFTSWTYSFVEVSEHNFESSHTWASTYNVYITLQVWVSSVSSKKLHIEDT